jgi:hypothetical protein
VQIKLRFGIITRWMMMKLMMVVMVMLMMIDEDDVQAYKILATAW